MTLQPDSETTIFARIRDAIAAASEITNFSTTSPERALVDALSEEQRERQHELLSVQLSSRIEFAGAEITDGDLDSLGLDPSKVDLDLLNSFQEDGDLDDLALRNGVTRDPGAFAEGTVTFQTSTDSAVIPVGTRVTTPPDADGTTIDFETTTEVTPSSGSTSVDAPVEALERGPQANLGAGSLTRLPSPPPQVVGDPAVTNSAPTTGGQPEETTAELRERTRLAIVGTAGGGTTEGIRSGLVERFDGLDVDDVLIDEDTSTESFDAVVVGGPADADLSAAIDDLRPVGIEGTLVRPTQVTVDVSATVSGSSIDTAAVESDLRDTLGALSIGDDVVRDQIIASVMTADDAIVGISTLTTTANGTSFSNDFAIGTREIVVPGTISISV
jgi:hypothetical protein